MALLLRFIVTSFHLLCRTISPVLKFNVDASTPQRKQGSSGFGRITTCARLIDFGAALPLGVSSVTSWVYTAPALQPNQHADASR